MRSLAIASATLGFLLAAGPPSAFAYNPGAGIADEGKTLSYLAAGDANNVTISLSDGAYTVVDSGVSSFPDADADGGCSVTGNQATCPASGISLIRVDAGDGNDTVVVTAPTSSTLVGGSGDDTLVGGASDDRLNGGAGNDAMDGGAGTDSVTYFGVSAVTVNLAVTAPQDTGSGGVDSLQNIEDLQGTAGNDVLSVRNGKSGRVICGGGADDIAVIDRNDVPSGCEHSYDTTLDSGPQGTTNDSTPAFTFSSSTNSSFECSMDGSPFADCSSPFQAGALNDGPHTFQVRARDAFGPDPSPASASFVVDTAAPPTGTSGAPQTGASGGNPPPVARPATSFVLIGGHAIKISRRGIAVISLNCLGRRDCSGRLTLSTAGRVKVGHKRHRIVRLGAAKFFIRAPLTKTVKVRLGKQKLKLVRRLRRLKAMVTVTDRDVAGRTRISTRPVLVKTR